MLSDKLTKKHFFTIEDFLQKYDILFSLDIKKGILLNFDIGLKNRSHNILQLAKIKHANNICNNFMNAYNGAHPFKIIENIDEIQHMIRNREYIYLIFKTQEEKIFGCVGAKLDFKNKRGYIFGFAIKKRYQGKCDNKKIYLSSLVYFLKQFKSQILVWTSELRPNSKIYEKEKRFFGLKPIAFMQNKDIFNNQIESEFFTIIHDKSVFLKYKTRKRIKIIKPVLDCYNYTNKRYNLGRPVIKNPILKLNKEKILRIKEEIIVKTLLDKYNDSITTIRIKNTDSYFQYQYNSYSNNIENINYHVDDLEELVVFLRRLRMTMEDKSIRYVECYVSAYSPKHQKIFYKAEFIPRGYLPWLQFNKKSNSFYDVILFNYSKEPIDLEIETNLISDTKELFKISSYQNKIMEIQINNLK